MSSQKQKQSEVKSQYSRLTLQTVSVAIMGQVSNFLGEENGLLMLDTVIVIEAVGLGVGGV